MIQLYDQFGLQFVSVTIYCSVLRSVSNIQTTLSDINGCTTHEKENQIKWEKTICHRGADKLDIMNRILL